MPQEEKSISSFEGLYSPSKRYMVHNWSDEDYSQSVGAETAYNDNNIIQVKPNYVITIKAGEMRELGQFEAYLFTKHFINREMEKDALKLTGKERERAEMGIHNEILRLPYEKKTIQEINPGETTPFMDKIRAEIRAEEKSKLQAESMDEKTTKVDSKEFADAKK